MWGPFGVSLAPQILASRTLSKTFIPLANSYAKISGHRQVGLRYDDLLSEESDEVQKALGRLPSTESYDRVFRIRRAVQQSILHKDLPKDQWLKPEEDQRYLSPYVADVLEEKAERTFWDTAEPVLAKK